MLVRGDREPAAVSTTSEDQQSNASPPPAPRGSSSPPPPKPQVPRFRPTRGWILFAVALLFFNFYIGSRATEPASRVRVPYSPFFLNLVSAGHVEEITSKGTAIQGTFKEKQQYAENKPTTKFRTEIPAFANNDALSELLQRKGVVVNAQPLDSGLPWWQNLLLGFGPTILFIVLLFWLMRRAGNVQNVLGSFGRSRGCAPCGASDPASQTQTQPQTQTQTQTQTQNRTDPHRRQ